MPGYRAGIAQAGYRRNSRRQARQNDAERQRRCESCKHQRARVVIGSPLLEKLSGILRSRSPHLSTAPQCMLLRPDSLRSLKEFVW